MKRVLAFGMLRSAFLIIFLTHYYHNYIELEPLFIEEFYSGLEGEVLSRRLDLHTSLAHSIDML